MAKRRPEPVSFDESGFVLDADLRAWLADKFPTVDPDGTYELFVDKALAKGWLYVSWPAAFRNYIRKGREHPDWGGIAYQSGMTDPAFAQLVIEAKAVGFRLPHKHESAGAYRTALKEYDRATASRQVSFIGTAIKRVPK